MTLHPALEQEWFVVVDDLVGGKAIGTADRPVSQYTPDETIIANFINEGFAGHMVMLHNVWLAERHEVEKLDSPFHTYRLDNGRMIEDQFAFMTTDDTWSQGELDGPEEVIHEVWECVHRERLTFKPDWWDQSRAEDEDERDAIDLAGGDSCSNDGLISADNPRLGDL